MHVKSQQKKGIIEKKEEKRRKTEKKMAGNVLPFSFLAAEMLYSLEKIAIAGPPLLC